MRRLIVALVALVALLALVPAAQAQVTDSKIRVVVGMTELSFDAPPVIENGRTLVPLRALAESLGFAVAYDAAERRVVLTKEGQALELWLGSTKAKANGKDFALEAAPKVMGDRTMVPVRFVAEQLGAHVTWNEADRLVYVRRGEEFARALYEQSQSSMVSGLPDMKAAGQMVIAIKVGGPGPADGMNLEMPMTTEMHTYQGDMMMTVTMSQPTPAGTQTVKTQQAIQGGKLFMAMGDGDQWVFLGEADPTEVLLQSVGGDMATVMQMDRELMKSAKVSFGGLETLDGTTVGRVDVHLPPSAMSALMEALSGQLGALGGQEDQVNMSFDRARMTFWINVETGRVQRYTMDMGLKMSGTQRGVALNMDMSLTADMSYRYVSEPITFPDFSDAVTP